MRLPGLRRHLQGIQAGGGSDIEVGMLLQEQVDGRALPVLRRRQQRRVGEQPRLMIDIHALREEVVHDITLPRAGGIEEQIGRVFTKIGGIGLLPVKQRDDLLPPLRDIFSHGETLWIGTPDGERRCEFGAVIGVKAVAHQQTLIEPFRITPLTLAERTHERRLPLNIPRGDIGFQREQRFHRLACPCAVAR